MLDGKLGKAPCGHPGVHVSDTIVICLTPECDGKSKLRCNSKRCKVLGGSLDVEPFRTDTFTDVYHCWDCGHVFTKD